jgi:hypothetical protein
MIRYPIALLDLRARIVAIEPTWFSRTAHATASLPAQPKATDFPELWTEVKDVYIKLQHSKCAFCEKPLEGRIEQDVEHFRPKTKVKPWDIPQALVDAGIVVSQPAGGGRQSDRSELGYRFLAYHPFNYAAACKPCNSVFKGNLFPIAGKREGDATDPPAHSKERPYLIYPIGDLGDDPETLITFDGAVPQAASPGGHDRFRAQVTIAIFKLDDPVERKVFYEGRARAIESLFLNLEAIRRDDDPRLVRAARVNVARMLRDSEPYANCLRCFHQTFQRSRDEAVAIFKGISAWLDSVSPA